MHIIAHRGARGLELENSLASLQAALRYDVDAIECDVHLTRDGELVVMHDANTQRTTGRNVRIRDATLAELRDIPLKNGQRIPTLDDVLRLMPNRHLFIDIKGSGCADPLVRLLQKYPDVSASFESFRPDELARIRELSPDAPTYLYFLKTRMPIARPFRMARTARRINATGISIDKLYLLNPLTYYWARRQGLEMLVYSVGSKRLVAALLRVYPELNIITGSPDTVNHRTLHQR